MLDDNEACCMDQISAEHLKNACYRLCPPLSLCFTGLIIHGVHTDYILCVLLVPVIMHKAAKLNSMGRNRPIALASILSEVLERIQLTRLEMFAVTTDNQFGFKRKHGTQCHVYLCSKGDD